MLRHIQKTCMSAVLQRSNVAAATNYQSVRGKVEDTLKDRESAAERLYFSKEDEKLMRNILNKVKSHADETDKAAPAHNASETASLKEIVGKYKMKDEDVKALLKWRHE